MTLRQVLKSYPGIELFFREKSARQQHNNRVAIFISLVIIAVCLVSIFFEMQNKGAASLGGLFIMLEGVLPLILAYAVPVLYTRHWRQTRLIASLAGEQWERIQAQVPSASSFGSCTLTHDAVIGYSRFAYRLASTGDATRVIFGFLGDTDRQVIPLSLIENAWLRRMEGHMDFLQLTIKPGYSKYVLVPLEYLLSNEEREQMREFFDRQRISFNKR